jgi:Kef-type K+ transport system membrane component KefB
MVLIASKTGFSAALGAFVMGSILAETREGKRIEHLLIPVRDLFSAVFFVSVGMMIDPATLREHFGVITILSVLLIVGKLAANTIWHVDRRSNPATVRAHRYDPWSDRRVLVHHRHAGHDAGTHQ